MNYRFIISCALVSVSLALPAVADVRELSRAELRANVQSGHSMSLSRLIRTISSKTSGEVVDVRGFAANGVFYRVLIKKPDGRLSVAIVDARSGAFQSPRSSVAREVQAAAKSNGNGSSRSNGNGNSGGNGGGNSGGNGNGNSGGNGNGNSGGNGNGNSGGNGGGNGGGKK